MISLSVCMIVRNEEDVLARCLDCIQGVADEIVIVDTGSIDHTKEIAAHYTPCIYDFPWCDDFAAARNFSFSKATKDYIMWLDADDVIDERNRSLLVALKQTLSPAVDMVVMKYDVAFDAYGNPTLSYYRERICKAERQYQWIGEIHEVIPQGGVVQHEDISICHRKMRPNEPGRNLKIFEKMVASGKKFDPRQQFYYARELYYNGRYVDAAALFLHFLDQGQGWIENNISACKDLAICYYYMLDERAALRSLLRSFTFDVPRAELCCEIGKHFFDRNRYDVAVRWYTMAANCPHDSQNGGFFLPDCHDYIPAIQLCVCYDRLGNRAKAIEYNEKAGLIKPNDQSYLLNKAYFASTAAQ